MSLLDLLCMVSFTASFMLVTIFFLEPVVLFGQTVNDKDLVGRYSLINDTAEDVRVGIYDKPLPCFGCGIGWFSFLLGFAFPVMWYYATILYFGSYYRKDPRERSGLAACSFAALACTVAVIIIMAVLLFLK